MRIGVVCAVGLACAWGCSQKQEGASTSARPSKPATEAPKTASRDGEPVVPSGLPPAVNPGHPDAQNQKPVPLKQGEEWVPAKGITALDVAKKVDQRVKTLAGVQANIHYEMLIPSGRGFGDTTQRIKSPTTFSLQYPAVRNGMPSGALARADGKIVVEKVGKKVTRTPITQKFSPRVPATVVAAWRENAGREALTGLLERRMPFTELIQSLPKEGYTVSIKQRTLHDAQVHMQYMISAQTIPKATTGKGLIEIILDGNLYLPLNFRVVTRKLGERADVAFIWSGQWLNGQQFDAKEFDTNGLKS